jgi:uncharacterized phage infection (PIP) family protein YhgE
MALTLNKTGITTGNTVQAYHVTQSIDAFVGAVAYDISLSGSFTVTGSVSNGTNNIASGLSSHAEGNLTRATGLYSHAEGSGSLSSGIASHAEGFQTTASGNYSLAVGFQNKALGQASFAGGLQTIANGPYAFSIGYLTYADNTAFAAGFSNSASGQYSFALGDTTKTIGLNSFTAGRGTIASGSQQFVIGEYNTQGDNTSIFIVGNGILGNPKDAFKVRVSGSIVLPSTQSVAPSWTGTNGEIIPATVGGVHLLYMWMAGAWRSSSFS